MLLIFAVVSTGFAGYVFYLIVAYSFFDTEEIFRTLLYDFGLVFPIGTITGIAAIIFQLRVLSIEKPNKSSGIIDDILIDKKRMVGMPRMFSVGHILFCISLLVFGLVFIPGFISRGSEQGFEVFMMVVTPTFFGASGLIYTADVIKKLRFIKTSRKG